MKRLIAIQMAILTLCSFLLSGCSSVKNDTIIMGQWLALIADSFGMENYLEEEPFFKNVNQESEYFYAFQTAAEWGILAPSDEIQATTPVTWKDVLVSLVNAGEFLNDGASDEEKIEYAVNHFDNTIRSYWSDRKIGLADAVRLLDIAQKMWADRKYDDSEKIEQYAFADEVMDFTQSESLKYMKDDENRILIPYEEVKDLQEGAVYVLPANEENNASMNRVKSIEIVDGIAVIENDDTFSEKDAEECIQEIRVRETEQLDFSKITGIYDEYGNPIAIERDDSSVENTSDTLDNLVAGSLIYRGNEDMSVEQAGLFDSLKGNIKFKTSDGKFDISIKKTSDSISVEATRDFKKIDNRYRSERNQIYGKATFGNVAVTKDIDYSWGKLHSATLKLDFESQLEFGTKKSRETRIGKPLEDGQYGKQYLTTVIKEYKNAIQNFSKEMRNSKCHEDIYICRISIWTVGVASVDFIIKGRITAEGDFKIIVECDSAKGIEYKNGHLRYIKTEEVNSDFVAEGKAEMLVCPGIDVKLFWKINVAELIVEVGAGVSAEMTMHLFDEEGHELYSETASIAVESANELNEEQDTVSAEDIRTVAIESGGDWKNYTPEAEISLMKGICLEWKLYPILRIKLDESSLIGNLARKAKVNLSLDILGEDTTIANGHIDFPNNLENMLETGMTASKLLGIGAECTYAYTPWDKAEEKLESAEVGEDTLQDSILDNEAKLQANNLQLSTIRIFLEPGQTQEIKITNLPVGYELSDIEVVVEDKDIAGFSIRDGVVIGKKEGITKIIVRTKDKMYTAYCAISVVEKNDVQFSELSEF